MAGLSYIDDFHWVYENPGTADLLLPNMGVTMTDLTEPQSNTGVAFRQSEFEKCFDIPPTNDIWIKFYVYRFSDDDYWIAYDCQGLCGIGIYDSTLYFSTDDELEFEDAVGSYNTVLLHMLSGSADGIIEAWIDGKKIHTDIGNVNDGEPFSNFSLNGSSMSIFSDITITNEASLVITLPEKISADLQRILSKTESIRGDLLRRSRRGKPEMIQADTFRQVSWRGLFSLNDTDWIYKNPGTADLLSINGTTLTNLPESQSKSGSAFFQTQYIKSFDLPTTPEIWIKFDVFSGSDRWLIGNAPSSTSSYYAVISRNPGYYAGRIILDIGNSSGGYFYDFKFQGADKLSTILLHMKQGVNDGIAEFWFNGELLKRYEGNVNNGNDFGDIFMMSGGANSFFSSVTISNAKIANSVSEKVSADLLRQTADYLTTFDCFIKPLIFATCFIPPQKVSADLTRVLSKTESVSGDLLRQIGLDMAIADSFRKVRVNEIISADLQRRLLDKISVQTLRKVTTSEKISADLFRALHEVTRVDSLRKVNRREKKSADTVIRVPHILNYVVKSRALKSKLLAADTPSLVDTFKDYGITAFNISLNEKTLSDDFTLELTRPMEINDAVQGTLLDYHFNFLVEETTQTDLVQIVRGRYNVDDLLYTWFTLTLDEKDFPSADWIAENIAHYFLLAADVAIDDFTPTNFSTGAMMTYSDVLSSVFGWTSRVPQRQVNVFIRGGTLHCIQRGKELSVFDISDLPHSRPTVNKKFNRVLVHNPNNDTDTDDTDDSDNEYRFTGTVSYSQNGIAPIQPRVQVTYTYQNGLLIKEYQATTTGRFSDGGETKTISNYSSTNYSYVLLSNAESSDSSISIRLTYYISGKTSTSRTVEQIWKDNGIETNITIQSTSVSYHYESNEGAVYLFQEHEQTTQTENGVTEKSWADTYHVPVGNGWYAQTVYRNGIFQGANLSQGAPSNAVSPYTIKQTQENLKGFDIKYTQPDNPPYEDDDNGLSAIVDDSFPVKETEFKSELNSDLRWLHRKIEETVTVDLISPVKNGVPDINHIVDFTERVKFNGAEYFLVSNRISFTPRKFIQKLQLIRWY